MTTPPRNHLLFLDGIRGIAAQAVLIGHATILAYPNLTGLPNHFYVQSYAVVVFLILSGYLIARSVRGKLERGSFSLGGYVKDRFARIFVPLVPLVPLVMIGDRLFLGESLESRFVAVRHDVLSVISNLVMLQDNWVVQFADRVLETDLSRRSLGSAAPWWTVALEWWIYLAFACVIAVLIGSARDRLWVALVGVFALASVVGMMLSGNMLPLGWVVGALFAWWERPLSRLSQRWWGVIAWAAVIVIAVTLLWRPGGTYSLMVVAATGVAILAMFRASSWPVLEQASTPIRFVADYSYSLYLIHFSVLIWAQARFPAFDGIPFIVATWVVANVVAVGCWWAFERHYPLVRRQMEAMGSRRIVAGVTQRPSDERVIT